MEIDNFNAEVEELLDATVHANWTQKLIVQTIRVQTIKWIAC